MKEQIYTIPIFDSFREGGECPFCNIVRNLDKESIDYMLGPSYMEGDIRMETNKLGFCKEHYHKMYLEQNRLGLGLMMHTHLQQINRDLNKLSATLTGTQKKGLFSKPAKNKNEISTYLNNITNSCYICNKINHTFERYVDTFFYMWTKKPEIKDFVKNSQGFCIEHFSMLLSVGEEKLNATDYKEFVDIVLPIELENLKRLEGEIEWFTDKFDYRYKDEPWGNSKDALPRGITKIASTFEEE